MPESKTAVVGKKRPIDEVDAEIVKLRLCRDRVPALDPEGPGGLSCTEGFSFNDGVATGG